MKETTMSLLGNFWRENSVVIAILLAVFAFIQPWFIMIWRKVFKKPQNEIHPAGNLEIGYNQFGATVGIRGVLLAINEEKKKLLENSAITADNPFRSVAGETASLFYFAYAEFKED